MEIVINSGSGKVKDGTWEQAYTNIKQFIEDCEIPMHIKSSEFEPSEDGRYVFVLSADDVPYETEIEMPALPLNKVRYMKEENQNIFDFPRLYVDGGSWIWIFAIVQKQCVIEQLECKIEELEDEIRLYKEDIEILLYQ